MIRYNTMKPHNIKNSINTALLVSIIDENAPLLWDIAGVYDIFANKGGKGDNAIWYYTGELDDNGKAIRHCISIYCQVSLIWYIPPHGRTTDKAHTIETTSKMDNETLCDSYTKTGNRIKFIEMKNHIYNLETELSKLMGKIIAKPETAAELAPKAQTIQLLLKDKLQQWNTYAPQYLNKAGYDTVIKCLETGETLESHNGNSIETYDKGIILKSDMLQWLALQPENKGLDIR